MRAMNRTLTATLAVAASLLAARAASADTRSWTAVTKVIGKSDTIVVGIDLARLRSTGAFGAVMQLMVAEEDEAKNVMDAVKTECGFDLVNVLSDVTVVMQRDGDHPLIAFGLDGIDEAKAVDCIGRVAGKSVGKPGTKLVGRKIGKLTEYSIAGEKEKLYAAWLTKDVLVFTEDVDDRKQLEKRLAGKGATGDLAKFIGRTSPAAPFWFAVAEKERENGRTMLGGHGKFELAGGVFKAAGAVVLSKAAEATSMAEEGRAGLAEAQKDIAAKSPELGRAISTITINAIGNEMTLTGSIPDKDIVTIIPQLDQLF
jgi:hypothetical protein